MGGRKARVFMGVRGRGWQTAAREQVTFWVGGLALDYGAGNRVSVRRLALRKAHSNS